METAYTFHDLSKRQQEIIKLRCRNDLSIAATAAILDRSTHTVKNHCSEAIRKLGLNSFQGVCYLAGLADGRLNIVDAQRSEVV